MKLKEAMELLKKAGKFDHMIRRKSWRKGAGVNGVNRFVISDSMKPLLISDEKDANADDWELVKIEIDAH